METHSRINTSLVLHTFSFLSRPHVLPRHLHPRCHRHLCYFLDSLLQIVLQFLAAKCLFWHRNMLRLAVSLDLSVLSLQNSVETVFACACSGLCSFQVCSRLERWGGWGAHTSGGGSEQVHCCECSVIDSPQSSLHPLSFWCREIKPSGSFVFLLTNRSCWRAVTAAMQSIYFGSRKVRKGNNCFPVYMCSIKWVTFLTSSSFCSCFSSEVGSHPAICVVYLRRPGDFSSHFQAITEILNI